MATLHESRAGAANLGIPLMITSFVVVAGFVFWLSVTAKPTEVFLPDPKVELVGVITFQEFSDGPGGYVDKVISLEDVRLSDPYGYHFQWINLLDANNNGYLLYYSDSLRADTTIVLSDFSSGMTVNLTGTVRATTDSVVAGFEAGGAFKSSVEALVVKGTYYLNFIEVSRIQQTFRRRRVDGSGSG